MDERHWWIAGKLQESFHIDGYDKPTMLEDFLYEIPTIEKINLFLSAGGSSRLFFYCDKIPTSQIAVQLREDRKLRITDSLATLKRVSLENIIIIYFIRYDVSKDVDIVNMHSEIYTGEIKGSPLTSLTTLLTEIFVPVIKAKKDWGECNDEQRQNLITGLERAVNSLQEQGTSTGSQSSSRQQMLRPPVNIVGSDFKQHRLAAADPKVIGEYETLITDWMATIEAIISDNDERHNDSLSTGPLSEVDRWKRRQRILSCVSDQLKGKDARSVVGVLITAKSRLIKKWKLVDCQMTDAVNETKDKLRYLEALKRHLQPLYTSYDDDDNEVNTSPEELIKVSLPSLLHQVRQLDSVSRYYARQGYLGYLFTKITNQLVISCKKYIQEMTLSGNGQTSSFVDYGLPGATAACSDSLWSRVDYELTTTLNLKSPSTLADEERQLLQNQLDNHFKRSSTKQPTKFKFDDSDSLLSRFNQCLMLQSAYRQTIRSLRDSLGTASMLSHYTSMGSIVQGGTRLLKPD